MSKKKHLHLNFGALSGEASGDHQKPQKNDHSVHNQSLILHLRRRRWPTSRLKGEKTGGIWWSFGLMSRFQWAKKPW